MTAVGVDPHLWLEEVDGDEALDWVRRRNGLTLAELGGDRFEQMRAESLEILDTDDRIPYPRRRGEYLYNFWNDANNPRGLWRRTTLEEYRTDAPEWDVVIDVDALAAAEGENWVWDGADVIEPDYTRCVDQPVARRRRTRRSCASSTWSQDNSSRTASRCRRPRPTSTGKTRTRCWSAPTSATVADRLGLSAS